MAPPSASLPASVLVVDDEPDLRTLYELTLLREGYRIDTAADLQEASLMLAQQRFDVVITDMRLPDGLGSALLHSLKAQQRSERVIVMTAYGSAENAVEALKAGAFDYLTKPVDLKQFRTVVASAIQDSNRTQRASTVNEIAPQRTAAGDSALQKLVGTSDAMQQVKQRIVKVARSMAPVLVRGESGTGKELVAKALHANSHRASGPLVAVNCSAIPESLLEAEFFGAKKGSYTGSTQDRQGYFQAARDGTLFLDEIGDLPLAMQSKLLRAIQERSVRALGSVQEEAVDVRIVSATHKDLAADVKAGRFRQDLYYRLNVIEIAIPPLRERRGDLPSLCEALLERIAQESGMPPPRLSRELLEQLANHPLSGNVRELENLLHRAVAMGDGEALHLDLDFEPTQDMGLAALPEASPEPAVPAAPGITSNPWTLDTVPSDLQAFLDRQEREILVKVLHETGFNRTAAANRLGLSLRQIRYRIERLNIATPQDNEPHDA
ncbi:MAG: sigma-54 dependent transcriptional regulator [Burkholderiales bacterium]|nr:sigma-54 dependent transcriptional regulator [Burkholderiales bacterium]